MSNLTSNLADALRPPVPALPTAVPREHIRTLLQMLALPPMDVRELNISPREVVVQHVVRDANGQVVMLDGLPTYRIHRIPITEPEAPSTESEPE